MSSAILTGTASFSGSYHTCYIVQAASIESRRPGAYANLNGSRAASATSSGLIMRSAGMSTCKANAKSHLLLSETNHEHIYSPMLAFSQGTYTRKAMPFGQNAETVVRHAVENCSRNWKTLLFPLGWLMDEHAEHLFSHAGLHVMREKGCNTNVMLSQLLRVK